MKRQTDALTKENTWMANKHVIKYSISSVTEKRDITALEWLRDVTPPNVEEDVKQRC